MYRYNAGWGTLSGDSYDGSDYCYAHDPERAEERRRNAHKGGKRGGRGRPSVELHRLQARFEMVAGDVRVSTAAAFGAAPCSLYPAPTGNIAAAAILVTIPIILFVLLFQRRIVAGLTAGAVKG